MSKPPTYHMRSRMIIVLTAMVVLGFCVVLHQLFKLQVIDGEALQARALQQQLRTTRIGAKRGTIYDTNENPLAMSANVWSVCIAPGLIDTEEKEQMVTDTLVKYLGLEKDAIKEKLKLKGTLYQVVKTKVEQSEKDALMAYVSESRLTGMIFFEQDTRRYYPYGNFASAVLGFTNDDNNGAYGLESYYEKQLSGTPGRVVSMKNSRGVDMSLQYSQEYQAHDGNSLVLTIDETIQHYLEKNIEVAVTEHKVRNRVTGIVMNVKTGEILAMASKPDFDPNNPYEILDPKAQEKLDTLNTTEDKEARKKALQEAWYAQWRNYAISDPYEPGSVFKIITASGALECGAVSRQSGFYCSGVKEVNGTPYHCWYWSSHPGQGHGQQDLEHAIMNSCNPAFIEIGMLMGAQNFRDYFHNFGLDEETGIDLPGEAGSIYHQTYLVNDLASSAFGQTFKITPIQMITAASAAVNGGNLMQPYVVKQIIDPQGNVVSATDPVVKRQVISEDISKEMCLMLEQVVANGSGRQAQIPGYRVGGKTGTSEQLDKIDPETRRTPNTLSFYGFAPIDDPQVACLVTLDDPDLYNAFGSTVAAPIVGAILADTLPYMGIEPQYTAEELEKVATKVPYVLNMDIHDAMFEVRVKGLKSRVIGSGTKVLRQMPTVGEVVPKDGTIVLYTEEQITGAEVAVPDVVGKTAEEANRMIVGAGLNISIKGDMIEGTPNIVASQEPAAGETAETGAVVTVTCVQTAPPAQ